MVYFLFVGAFNLLKEDEYKFNAEALEDTLIITLSKSKFDKVIKNSSITLKILEKAYERMILNLFMNREDMGNYTGFSRETMTRKLLLFQELGYIDFLRNKKTLY